MSRRTAHRGTPLPALDTGAVLRLVLGAVFRVFLEAFNACSGYLGVGVSGAFEDVGRLICPHWRGTSAPSCALYLVRQSQTPIVSGDVFRPTVKTP